MVHGNAIFKTLLGLFSIDQSCGSGWFDRIRIHFLQSGRIRSSLEGRIRIMCDLKGLIWIRVKSIRIHIPVKDATAARSH